MAIELLDRSNLSDYISLMSNYEIFGISEGFLTGIGEYDEKKNMPKGLCILEIRPTYILMRRMFSDGDVETAADIAEFIMQLPKEDQLPIYYISAGKYSSEEKKILSGLRFNRINSDYLYLSASLSAMRKLPKPDPSKGLKPVLLEKVSEGEMWDFIEKSPHDTFLQMPWAELNPDRFGESIIIKRNGKITAVLLSETYDDYVEIPWLYSVDAESLAACFFMLHGMYSEDEDEANTVFRFLMPMKSIAPDLTKIFDEMKDVPLRTYQLTPMD